MCGCGRARRRPLADRSLQVLSCRGSRGVCSRACCLAGKPGCLWLQGPAGGQSSQPLGGTGSRSCGLLLQAILEAPAWTRCRMQSAACSLPRWQCGQEGWHRPGSFSMDRCLDCCRSAGPIGGLCILAAPAHPSALQIRACGCLPAVSCSDTLALGQCACWHMAGQLQAGSNVQSTSRSPPGAGELLLHSLPARSADSGQSNARQPPPAAHLGLRVGL